jgi:hypothetical protein
MSIAAIADSPSPSPRPEPVQVALLRADAQLRGVVPEAERDLAQRAVVLPGFRLPAGPWYPDLHAGSSDALIVSGLLIHDIALAASTSSHLFGPGDPVRPWTERAAVVPAAARWTVAGPGATVAILDERFALAERRWPQLATAVRQRLADQADAAVLRAAITSLPRVEQRLLAMLWHLADRWGVVRPDGVVVPLKLTHELLGRLVGAKRPTVSLALAALAADGTVRALDNGAWCLDPGSAEALRGARASIGSTSACLLSR